MAIYFLANKLEKTEMVPEQIVKKLGADCAIAEKTIIIMAIYFLANKLEKTDM
jgi:hypothetical protein